MTNHWLGMMVAGVCLWFIAGERTVGAGRPIDPTPPAGEMAGERPYELNWSARTETPSPQVPFDNLQGWTLEVDGDVEVNASASIAQRIWRPSVLKIVYGRGSKPSVAMVRPPKPITINEPFDAARAWVFGGWYRRAQDDKKPPQINILLQDSAGQPVRIAFGPLISGNWSIEQGVLAREVVQANRFPMKFVGIEFADIDFPEGSSELFIESLTFYQQNRNPAAHPFAMLNPVVPTSDDGMVPTPPADVKTSVGGTEHGVRFISDVDGARLSFDITPANGLFDGISARWNDGQPFQPAAEGGVLVETSQDHSEKLGKAKVVKAEIAGNAYHVTWRGEASGKSYEWSATYTLRGRTLLVDVACDGGGATGLNFGVVRGLDEARGIFVPYMMMGRIGHVHTDGPLVASGEGVFVSVLPDLYKSDFSTVDNTPSEASGDTIRLFSATTYFPLTDGKRNNLRDRMMISISDEFHDILPNARNPVSPNRERFAPYMFFSTYYPAIEMFTTLKRLGVDNLVVMDKNATLVGNDYQTLASFPMRWRPMPQISISQLQQYIQEVKALGYRFSMYSYFPDLSPVNEYWDEGKVALKWDGSLAPGNWYGDYAIKMNDASRMVAALGPLVRDLYAPDSTYLDIQSNMGPDADDYEAGVEGAGKGRYTVLGNVDSMLEARKHFGNTLSEGYHRWFYTGATDGDYATLLHPTKYKSASELPLLVDFDLLKIHPFGIGTMMSFEPKYFLEEEGDEWNALLKEDGSGEAPIGFYKYLSASLGYGHMAIAGYDYIPPPARVIQLYAMMQGVQREYLADSVKSIEYENGSTFLSTSEALRTGAVELGRLRVEYSQGLVLYVNYNRDKPWTVTGSNRSYDLPPFGWLIEKPAEVLAYSALVDGHRVDAIRCADYAYVNTGGQPAKLDDLGLELQGAAFIKRTNEGLQVIPCGALGAWEKINPEGWPGYFFAFHLGEVPVDRGLQSLRINAKTWFDKSAGDLTITARTMDMQSSPLTVEVEADAILLRGHAEVADYIIR